jgi:hypothetical protein
MTEQHVINLSTAWEPPEDGSRAWVRRFGRPSGVESGDRVWLVHTDGRGETLVLNGIPLAGPDARHDVTTLLSARNALALTPAADDPIEGGVPNEVLSPPLSPPSPPLSHGRRPLDPCHGRLHLEIEHGLP